LECGGKRSATPLWGGRWRLTGACGSGIAGGMKAVSQPPHSKTASVFRAPLKFAGASWSAAASGARRRFGVRTNVAGGTQGYFGRCGQFKSGVTAAALHDASENKKPLPVWPEGACNSKLN